MNINNTYSGSTIVAYLTTSDLINLSVVSKDNNHMVVNFHPKKFKYKEKLAHRIQSLERKINRVIEEEKMIRSSRNFVSIDGGVIFKGIIGSYLSYFFHHQEDKSENLDMFKKQLEFYQKEFRILSKRKSNKDKWKIHCIHNLGYKPKIYNQLKVIYSIFGGEKNFFKTPILDIIPLQSKLFGDTNLKSENIIIDYIPKRNVKYAVMKGIDCYNRFFFVIKNKDNKMQVFFEQVSDPDFANAWSASQDSIVNLCEEGWLDHYNLKKAETQRAVAELTTLVTSLI